MNILRTLKATGASLVLVGLIACGGGYSAAPTYTVGGTIAGLVGNATLQLNGANPLSATSSGSFTFPMALDNGASYNVSVSASDQLCRVNNASGTTSGANVSNVAVVCTTVVRSSALSGALENPPVTTTASGRGAVIVNPTTREITGGITFTGVTPSAGGHHIHQAPVGNPTANGPVIVALVLAAGGNAAVVPAGTVLTAAQYSALLAGELYFNVHSAANPGGEIRGRISVQGGVTAGLATLNSAQEVPTNGSTATGRGSFVFDTATREVIIGYATHNVVAASVAHVHTGAVGVSGPANVVTLAAGTNLYSAPHPTTLTAQNAIDFNAGNTYFNVHSPTYPGGEIRGQIELQ